MVYLSEVYMDSSDIVEGIIPERGTRRDAKSESDEVAGSKCYTVNTTNCLC